MFQDPSIGKYKAYYVITKIFHIKSVENEVCSSKKVANLLS